MPNKDFDVIIIGAGPAGSACAYTLVQNGKTVLVVERGDFPGAKNVTGGKVYASALEQLERGLSTEARVERRIVHQQRVWIDGKKSNSINCQDAPSFTLLRSKFDRWLASQAEKMGAMLICGVRVDDLVDDHGKVAGIVAGEDKIYCDMVIAADGVNSLIAEKAGLIHKTGNQQVCIGVKEIIEMEPEMINRRFGLKAQEGLELLIFGCTEGMQSRAFLYTNLQSISLGAFFDPGAVLKSGKTVPHLLQELKMHPFINPLISGGKTVEYAAHLVSGEVNRNIRGQLYKEGFLAVGDAAGLGLNLGYNIHGMDVAILSGIAAARAVVAENEPAAIGISYEDELQRILSPVFQQAYQDYENMQQIIRNAS
jgi:Dehydrogenases (flavoproteins)